MVGAVTMALYHRDARGGKGQVIDASILAPLLTIMTKPLLTYDQTGKKEKRVGNHSTGSAPRRTFRTKDGKWVSIVAATPATAERMMSMVGHPEVAHQPWFKISSERLARAPYLESLVEGWLAERTRDEALRIAEEQEVTLAPVYEVDEVYEDPHVKNAGMIREIEDKDFGKMRLPNVLFRLSETPGAIRWMAEDLGAATDAILSGELRVDPAEVKRLRDKGVVF
jgi:crotonobetainyl-CoA:carnitine CoA-transferase CaiB-like acyl-CoA transferase